MTKPSLPLIGGCQCGKLRYAVNAAPLMICCCHCTNCQKISGSAFAVSTMIEEASFEFTSGTPSKMQWTADSGNQRYGLFCRDCGTRIAHGQTPPSGILSLRAGTFDDTSWVEPAGHIWTASAQKWVKFGDDELVFEKQPADYSPIAESYKAQERFD